MLDFGLAKALDPNPSGPGSDTLGMSPTVTSAGTIAGTILGTAGYMSPEQAKGKPVDRRADIWAFGCVLHEMLTGKPLFEAETISETLAAVLMKEPDLDALPASTSPSTRWLLQRCLTKNPKLRLRDIGEARLALESPETWVPAGDAGAATDDSDSPVRSRATPLIGAAVVAIAAFLGGMLLTPNEDTPLPLRKFEISRDAVDHGFDNPPLLSPDGQRIAYVHDGSIWVRDFARLVPTKLVEEGDTPFWSADGQQIGFERDRKLWRVAVGGGEPSLVCDLPDRASIVSAAWSADGTIWLAAWRGGLYSVSARGGDPELALEAGADEVDFHDVSVLPDQSSVMFVNHQVNPETGDWLKDSTLIVLRDGKRHEVVIDPGIVTIGTPVYSRGYLLYHRESSGQGLWAAPFSPVDLEVTGPPVPVGCGCRTAQRLPMTAR